MGQVAHTLRLWLVFYLVHCTPCHETGESKYLAKCHSQVLLTHNAGGGRGAQPRPVVRASAAGVGETQTSPCWLYHCGGEGRSGTRFSIISLPPNVGPSNYGPWRVPALNLFVVQDPFAVERFLLPYFSQYGST